MAAAEIYTRQFDVMRSRVLYRATSTCYLCDAFVYDAKDICCAMKRDTEKMIAFCVVVYTRVSSSIIAHIILGRRRKYGVESEPTHLSSSRLSPRNTQEH